MEKIRCLIVDDEQQNIDLLEELIFKYCPALEVVDTASSVDRAVEQIRRIEPDLVFLDVEMPPGSGFDVLASFPEQHFNVIVTTAHTDYAIRAIKYEVADYLLKPIDLRELRTAVSKISNQTGGDEKTGDARFRESLENYNAEGKMSRIRVKTDKGIELFPSEEVLRVEANKLNCLIHFKDGEVIEIRKCLKDHEPMLRKAGFFRVHKSHMVNLQHISKYLKGTGGQIVLSDDTVIDVAVRRKKDLLEQLHQID